MLDQCTQLYKRGRCSTAVRQAEDAQCDAGSTGHTYQASLRTESATHPAAARGVALPLPQELLGEVLAALHASQWPTIRLVNKQFEAALAPLVKTITVRQWPSNSPQPAGSCRIRVAASSSLARTQHLVAAVDNPTQLHQLLQLLSQLPGVTHLTCRGLKPFAGLQLQLQPHTTAQQGHNLRLIRNLEMPHAAPSWSPPGAAVLAGLTRLDLPDSSSSSLPSHLQLSSIKSMALYAADSIARLAAVTPNLQHLECFSVTITHPSCQPAPSHDKTTDRERHLAASSSPGHSQCGHTAGLTVCVSLAAQFVTTAGSTTGSAAAVMMGLAVCFPKLRLLRTLPTLQLQPQHNLPVDQQQQQQCQQLLLAELQQVLPSLRRACC